MPVESLTEQELQDLLSALNLYTSFFLFLIVLCFVAFITILVILIRNIENRKSLKDNRTFISEIIQTQEDERKRISQELHDTVSQNIKTLLIEQKRLLSDMGSISRTVPNENISAEETSAIKHIEQIIKLERQNQKELRAIIRNLSIPLLSTVPFKTVINDLCEQFSEQSDIPCTFFVEQDVTFEHFTNEQKHHIVRIIQEALNNVRIHADAEETSVIIRKVGHSEKDVSVLTHHDKIRIMIFDDGIGFDTTAIHDAGRLHFGMSGMEMRAKLLGGTLIITSRPETGTEVRLEVPLEKEMEACLQINNS
ncbi:MAG: histidine kinase [Treponema sp.]